jgi:hypothetical protein
VRHRSSFSITTRFPFDTEGRFPFDTAAAAAPGGGGAGPAPSAALGGLWGGRTKPDAPPSKRRSALIITRRKSGEMCTDFRTVGAVAVRVFPNLYTPQPRRFLPLFRQNASTRNYTHLLRLSSSKRKRDFLYSEVGCCAVGAASPPLARVRRPPLPLHDVPPDRPHPAHSRR